MTKYHELSYRHTEVISVAYDGFVIGSNTALEMA